MKRKISLLFVSILLVSFSFLSNLSISYAVVSETKNYNTGLNYYFLHYNGQEQNVAISDKKTLILDGWADEEKTSVNARIESSSDSTTQAKTSIIPVSDELNELVITEDERIFYRIVVSDTFHAENVRSFKLSDQVTVLEDNENGTFIEELKTVDEYGTVIENKGLTYYSLEEDNQKVEITQEQYNSFNSHLIPKEEEKEIVMDDSLNPDLSTEVFTSQNQSKNTQGTVSSVTDEENLTPVQSASISATTAHTTSVVYSTHVQDYGWLEDVKDGELSGTEGEAKRMEAIKLSLLGAPYAGDISYRTHVQSYGWLNNVSSGAVSGTSGERKRLEAIQINLTGEMAEHYDVYYRVHAQSYGWLGWAKNGESAGTQGLAKRLEAIEVQLVKKGGAAPGSTSNHFIMDPSIVYSAHVQDLGWLTPVSDRELSGTEGEAKRMEAIKVYLENAPYSGSVSYKTHLETYGWLDSVTDGSFSGTSGERKRMEAIQISLTGEMAKHYDVYYRVHAQSYGWLDWAKNGETAGTQGLAKRLEAIEVVLIEKGGVAPGPTNRPCVVDPSVVYSTHVESYGWLTSVSDGESSGTEGQKKRMEAIRISLANIPYPGGVSYRTHVQSYGWINPVSNGATSGTSGERKRLEAIQINLTGEMANHFDVYYRVHAESYGWLGWAKNGESAGTASLAKRLEAIEIVLVKKGTTVPGSTGNSFIQPSLVIANNYYNLTLNSAINMQMKASPQTDKYRNSPAYVSSDYISLSDKGTINESNVNLRSAPTTNSSIYANVGNGTAFTILDSNVIGDNVSNSKRWFKINYNGATLYVHSSLAQRTGQVTADTLNIRAEQSTNSHIYGTVKRGTVLTILEEGSNGWHNVSIGTWRNATATDVKQYLDPTSYINDEEQRLQFMDLTKPTEVSSETLNQYLLGKGILANQGKAFIEAGKKHGINEVYLMAHTLLETGHGTSTLAKGVLYNGRTVYNMYGIGAYDNCAVECGAKRAYDEQWFTPYDAIVGGAAFISNKYLGGNNPYNIVQNTLYEMRWNPQVMANRGVAGNQYATDIGWATKQVAIMYGVYRIQQYSINLEIPIYK